VAHPVTYLLGDPGWQENGDVFIALMQNLPRVFLFTLAYFVGAEVGHSLVFYHALPAAFWPPSGIFLAALLLTESRIWPYLVVGALLGDTGCGWINHLSPISVAFLSIPHIVGILIGAWLIRRFVSPFPNLYSLREVLALLGFTVIFPTLISMIPLFPLSWNEPAFAWTAWKQRWIAEALGILLYAPLILTWSSWRFFQFRKISYGIILEAGFLFCLLLFHTLGGIFLYPSIIKSYKFLAFPLMVWAGLRLGPRGSISIIFPVFNVALWALFRWKDQVVTGHEPLVDYAIMLQVYMTSAIAVALLPAATLAERESLLARLDKVNRLNTVIGQINQMIVKTHDTATLLGEACRIMVEFGHFRMVWVGKVDKDSGEVRPISHAGFEEGYLSNHTWRIDDSPWGAGLVGTAFREGACAVIEDAAADPSIKPWRTEALKRGYQSGGAFVITLDDQEEGALVIYSEETGFFDPGTITLLREVASDISLALDGIRETEKRRQAEEALRQMNERMTGVIQASPVGIVVLDRDGVVQAWNPFAERMFGYSMQEVMGQFLPTVRGVKEEELRQNIASVLSGETISLLEAQRQHKDGHMVDVSISTAPLREVTGAIVGLVAIYVDLTERKRFDEVLRQSEEQFRILIQYLPIGIAVMAPDHKMVFANPAFTQITGYTLEDIPTKEIYFSLVYPDPDYQKKIYEYWSQDLFTDTAFGTHSHRVFRLRCKDGTDKDCIVRTVILAGGQHVYTYYDITEQRRAEIALEESERRFRELLQNVGLYAILLDTEGRVTFANEFLFQKIGWTWEELEGKNWFEVFIPQAEYKETYRRYLAAMEGEDLAPLSENSILTRDGGIRLVAWNNTLLRDPTGRVVGMACLGIDVTEHRRLEEQYRQSQRMEAVGQLAGGVAHDFNNLLQAIQGYTDLALSDLPQGTEAHQNLSESQRAIDRAAGLVRQLLAFSRRQTLQFRVVDLDEVIANLSKILRRTIGEHIELEIEPGCAGRKIQADPGQMEQILLNLCLNARDAMPEGGKIHLETGSICFDHSYVEIHSWAREGEYVQLSVSDSGCGMPPEVLDKIFEPFFTTKAVGQGTGLGLATVYGIIRQHEGMIHVYSEVNRGTTFRVYLPVSKIEQPQLPVNPEQARPRGGSETILIAEDEELLRDLGQRILRNAGYTVLAAADGEEALKIYHENSEKIDLLLLDMIMPKLSGRQVYETVVETNPTARFIFSTGYSFTTLNQGQLPKEDIPFIQKPYSPSSLLKLVREVLGG
jgi:two-component system, cell cycle sensor histidine kinase and response regulator CckA